MRSFIKMPLIVYNKLYTHIFSSENILLSTTYIPHGHCYLWQTPLVGLHVSSDLFIALAYYSIPTMLVYFVSQRKEVPFRCIFVLFSAFILSCGTTHIVDIWTLWHGDYWLSGILKALTALISIYTAIELFSLIPQAMALPSPGQLEELNRALQQQIKNREEIEIAIRKLNEELEARVLKRTEELEHINGQLQQEVAERKQVEASLKENKNFTEKILNLIPEFVYVYDLVEKKNVYSNQFITDKLGYSPKELKEMGNELLKFLIHPEDQEIIFNDHQNYIKLQKEEKTEIEYRIKDKRENWHWVSSRETVFDTMPNGNIRQIIGCATDITERKNSELHLKDLSEQLSSQVQQLEKNTQEMIQLGKISDFLQNCSSVTEALTTLSNLLEPLFDNASGVLSMYNNNSNKLEIKARWGEEEATGSSATVQKCWGAKGSGVYQGDGAHPTLNCSPNHPKTEPIHSMCVLMVAQEKTLGMLYLNFQKDQQLMDSKKWLAETVTKQISIGLANLQLKEKLERQSYQDPLTGVYNRRYLEKQLKYQVEQAQTKAENLGLIIIDIDFFKHINDTYGHDAGDLVIRTIAECLQKNSSPSKIVCRYGGEEFVLIVPNTSIEELVEIAENLRNLIKNIDISYEDLLIEKITASFGVSCLSGQTISSEQLFKLADQALYEAKTQGRDRVMYSGNHLDPPS